MKKLKEELIDFRKELIENVKTSKTSSLVAKLDEIIKTIPSEREEACERLSHLICDDEDRYASMEEAIQLLEAQADIDGSVMADHVVRMWEKVEYSFTVDELLSEIGL